MKRIIPILLALMFFSACSQANPTQQPIQTHSTSITKTTMQISSTSFNNNENLPAKYSCDGTKISPPLQISDIPSTAKSLALIFEDPDAPAGTFYHWLVWNISPDTTEIKENSAPNGAIQGTNTGDTIGYYPPCPPSGIHKYTFKIFALDTLLALPSSTTAKALYKAMEGHILDQAEIISPYSRT